MRRAQRRRHQPRRGGGLDPGEQHGRDRFGARQYLDRDLFERGQRAVGAGHQLRQIVAGDVLDDLAAGLEDLAAAADRAEAEEMVARRAGLDAARPRQIAGEDAAQGRLRPSPPSSPRQSGGSNASIWPASASARSISASGVAAPAVSTSSLGA